MNHNSRHASILAFELDAPEAGLNFSHRLALENGWSAEFTRRAIEEYKRFVILCAEAGHPVTPSDAVDQVWHLHLCYTHNYWNDLCRDTLGFPLHHGPTLGGAEERTKFDDWYRRTLNSYERIFNQPPPSDIWPDAKLRFAPQDFRRVDFNRHLVIPKRRLLFATLATLIPVGLAGMALP